MPTTIADFTWHIASGVTILLITAIGVIVWWGFRNLSEKVDLLIASNSDRRVETAIVKTALRDHINDEGRHCKGADCFFHKERVSDG